MKKIYYHSSVSATTENLKRYASGRHVGHADAVLLSGYAALTRPQGYMAPAGSPSG